MLLKKANGGDSRSARLAARSRIFDCNSSNRNHRDGYGATNLSQFVQPLRRTKACFRGCRKNRPKEKIIRTLLRRGDSAAHRVTGSPHEKVCQSRRTPRIYQQLNRKRLFPGVHACSACSPSHIASIIDENPRRALCRKIIASPNCAARKVYQVARRQIFLPDLNPMDSCAHSILDALRQVRLAVRAGRNIQRGAVRYVAKNKFVGCFQRSGARILSRMRLPPQHSRGDGDIQRTKPADDATHRWMQDERPKAGIVAQEIVSVP